MKSLCQSTRRRLVYCSLVAVTAFGAYHLDAVAQQPITSVTEANGVTMTIFPVARGTDGQQYITTKDNFKVTVPGLGIAPDATAIAVYRSPQNQFWYVDKNDKTTPVSAAQLQWTESQINNQQSLRALEIEKTQQSSKFPGVQLGTVPSVMAPAGMVPSGMVPAAMAPVMPQQSVIVNQVPAQSGASTAMVSGLAAATGAMAGSAISSSIYNSNNGYHGIPYGAACYTNAGHSYYNAADGAHEIPMHTDNPYVNQWGRQQAYQNNSQNRQNAYNNLNENQQQMLKNESAEHLDQRRTTEAGAAAAGDTRMEGDAAVRENRFSERAGRLGGFRR